MKQDTRHSICLVEILRILGDILANLEKWKACIRMLSLQIQAILFEEKIEQSDSEYPLLVSTRHDMVFDDNDLLE